VGGTSSTVHVEKVSSGRGRGKRRSYDRKSTWSVRSWIFLVGEADFFGLDLHCGADIYRCC